VLDFPLPVRFRLTKCLQGTPLGRLTAGIGLYVATPGAEERLEDFLHQADRALCAGKHGEMEFAIQPG